MRNVIYNSGGYTYLDEYFMLMHHHACNSELKTIDVKEKENENSVMNTLVLYQHSDK